MKKKVKKILDELLLNIPELTVCRESIIEAYNIFETTYRSHGKILICGSGGSAADSAHMVGELMKEFTVKRPPGKEFKEKLISAYGHAADSINKDIQGALSAIDLTAHTSLITAFINDVGPDNIFAQQVYGYGNSEDSLCAFSTSGNSINTVNAIMVAKVLGIKTIGFTGKDGGRFKQLCDVSIIVPAMNTHRVQEYHLPVYHALCAMLETYFFDQE